MHKDALIIGAIVGLVIPFVGYALIMEIYDQLENSGVISDIGLSETFRKRTMALLAICLNLIPFSIYNRRYMYNSMRGIIFPTVVYVITWLVYFSSSIF